jgi:cytoskeleton protein RodZ
MSEALSEAMLGAGAQLRAARVAGGLSTADVAAKLKLALRQVEAIEAEDWQALPEATFTRGFVRSYARLVGVDESALRLDNLRPVAHADLAPQPDAMGEVTYDGHEVRPNAARWLIPVLLLTTLVGGVAWFMLKESSLSAGTQITKPATESASDATKRTVGTATNDTLNTPVALPTAVSNGSLLPANPTSTPATESIAPPTVISPPSSVPSTINPPPLSARTQPALATESVPQTATSSPVTPLATAVATPQQPTPTPAPALLLDGKKRIVLNYTGLSWTEVRSKGSVVFSERVNSGTREITAAPPLSFVIGNADSVSVTIDGKPYDFSNSQRDAVARFRIE